jgi:hypothetical protein
MNIYTWLGHSMFCSLLLVYWIHVFMLFTREFSVFWQLCFDNVKLPWPKLQRPFYENFGANKKNKHVTTARACVIIPRRWNREGDIVLALSVRPERPSFRPPIRPSEFRFRSSSLHLLAGIQRNFMGTFNTKRICAYRRLVPVRHFNSELWPLISYAVSI